MKDLKRGIQIDWQVGESIRTGGIAQANSPASIAVAVMPPFVAAIRKAHRLHSVEEDHSVGKGLVAQAQAISGRRPESVVGRRDVNRLAVVVYEPHIYRP